MKHFNKLIATSAVALMASASANAAGFAIKETSSTLLGRAFAGAGADKTDVSATWNNPAIAAFMNGVWNFAAQGTVLFPKAQFTNDGSNFGGVEAALTGGDADGGKTAFVPSLYAAWRAHQNVTVGLAVTSPFGLATKYASDWRGRFEAIKSDLKTININPFVAFKIHRNVSLGLGASVEYANIELTNKIDERDFGGVAGNEADFKAEGTDWGYGFNAGIFIQDLWYGSNIGIHYRSAVHHKLSGTATASNLSAGVVAAASTANLVADGVAINAALCTPENVSIDLVQHIADDFRIMATATWTRWTSLEKIAILTADTGAVVGAEKPLNWANAWFFSLGADYQINDKWTVKGGVAYDQTPTQDSTRSPVLPGNDRWWLSAGLDWTISDCAKVGLSYTHVFIKDASISNTTTGLGGTRLLKGNYCSNVNIVGVQANFKF